MARNKKLSFKEQFENWKPIHLCWLFEKLNIPIPKYLIGGAAGTAVLAGSRIANATRSWQADEDLDVTDWTKTSDFIFAVSIETEAGKKTNKSLNLRWRNKTEGGSFTSLAVTGELNFLATTDLVDLDAVTSGEAGCTPSASQTWQDGTEREGGATVAFDTGVGADMWSEYQWGIDCSGAQDGDEYEFEIYNNTDSVSLGTCTVSISMTGGVIYEEFNRTVQGAGVVSCIDNLVAKEINKTVESTCVISEDDVLIGKEINKTAQATAVVSCTDDLIATESNRAVQAAGVVSCSDDLILRELNKTIQTTGVVSCSDLLIAVEPNKTVVVNAVISCSDDLTGVIQELDRAVQADVVVSCIDKLIGQELNKTVQATIVLSEVDLVVLFEDTGLGEELLINGSLTGWTDDDPDDWSVIGESGNDPECSEVGAGEGHGGSGIGLCNLYNT